MALYLSSSSSSSQAQAAHLASLVEPLMLRRLGRDVRPPGPAAASGGGGGGGRGVLEVQLPVDMSAEQVDCYKTLLARCYETLADPKPSR